jgi:hypothetical protein
MTDQNLTWPEILVIHDPGIAALFLKDSIPAYLAQFIGAESTVKRAAQNTGTKLNVMAYWARRFLHLGLLRVTRIEARGGSAITHYRSTANQFIVPVSLIDGFTQTEILQHVMRRDYDRFSSFVVNTGMKLTPDWQLRLYRDHAAYGTELEPAHVPRPQAPMPKRPLHDWAYIHLPEAVAATFREELEALFERMKRAAQPASGHTPYAIHVGFVKEAD